MGRWGGGAGCYLGRPVVHFISLSFVFIAIGDILFLQTLRARLTCEKVFNLLNDQGRAGFLDFNHSKKNSLANIFQKLYL